MPSLQSNVVSFAQEWGWPRRYRRRVSRARVLLAAPYSPRGGGMGRMMAYFASEATQMPEFEFSVIETRGGGPALASAWFMVLVAGAIVRSAWAGPTILHVNMAEGMSVFRKGFLLMVARLCGAPVVLHLHASDIESFYNRLLWPFDGLVRVIFRSASRVIVLGAVWQFFLTQRLGVPNGRIRVIPNGVPDTGGVCRRTASDTVSLVFVGNLLPRKGLADLLHALGDPRTARRAWTLSLAGGGSAAAIHALRRSLRLEGQVCVLGWLRRGEITELFRGADIVILPSYHEALPLVLLEAACHGCAIITTTAGAIGEYFTHGKDAMLVSPGDIAALRAAINDLLDDAALRATLGQNARLLYDSAFTMRQMTQSIADIYRDCLRPGA